MMEVKAMAAVSARNRVFPNFIGSVCEYERNLVNSSSVNPPSGPMQMSTDDRCVSESGIAVYPLTSPRIIVEY
jgi:hypothetical protein